MYNFYCQFYSYSESLHVKDLHQKWYSEITFFMPDNNIRGVAPIELRWGYGKNISAGWYRFGNEIPRDHLQGHGSGQSGIFFSYLSCSKELFWSKCHIKGTLSRWGLRLSMRAVTGRGGPAFRGQRFRDRFSSHEETISPGKLTFY